MIHLRNNYNANPHCSLLKPWKGIHSFDREIRSTFCHLIQASCDPTVPLAILHQIEAPQLHFIHRLYISTLRIITARLVCFRGSWQRIKTIPNLHCSVKKHFWYVTHMPAKLEAHFEPGDIVDRCSGFVLLLTVSLLRSPQDIPPP